MALRIPTPPTDQTGHPRTAAASYIAALVRELAELAREEGLDALGYILDMARIEAENVLRHDLG